MTHLVRYLRAVAFREGGDRHTDADLLEAFLNRRDEAAFETLLRRHGPMVLGVCRRTLGNTHDAEDAFQATFLVLVRKAATIRATGARLLITANPGCSLQIATALAAQGLSMPVAHTAQVLDASIRGLPVSRLTS